MPVVYRAFQTERMVSVFSSTTKWRKSRYRLSVAKIRLPTSSVTGLTIGGVATQGTYAAPTTFVDDDDSHYGTWSVSGQKIEDITPRNANDKDGQTDSKVLATYEAIVIPQTVSNGTKLFTITAEGYRQLCLYNHCREGMAPGKEYTYTITIKGDKLEVSVSDGNINWDTDGATGSGEVELP